ncbi:hypothetical protein DPMN_109165 [Dreissena polymorpha]|uniref:Uncharacterized protein n=1 Tax=Dreissena polymorpha TaxID=45954 RepID=A0A9D4QLP6_DREPO|nr:hypothetical protein DPMN_109165 [Dreissena polymorpha]
MDIATYGHTYGRTDMSKTIYPLFFEHFQDMALDGRTETRKERRMERQPQNNIPPPMAGDNNLKIRERTLNMDQPTDRQTSSLLYTPLNFVCGGIQSYLAETILQL